MYLLYAVSFVGGLFILKSSVTHFLKFKENQARGQNSGAKIVVGFIIAGALLSPTKSINLTLNTLGIAEDGGGYCFAYKVDFINDHQTARNKDISQGSGDVIGANSLLSNGSNADSCLTAPLTKLQGKLKDKTGDSGLWDKLKDSSEFQFLVGMIQVIAMYFYFSAWFKVWSISEGKGGQGETYGPQAITIFFSSLVYNLPATLDLVIASAEKLFG